MRQTAATRARTHRALGLTPLFIVTVAIIGTLVYQSASSRAPSFAAVPRGDPATGGPRNDGAVTEADGALPDGVTVFDAEYPGIANLDPDLLRAVRDAATDAAADGIELHVTSGWRSSEYQEQLLRDAVARYGSAREAARWVATADTSAHVSGDAIDIGPVVATAWLSEHGARYGLCQIYSNEPWHYELRPNAVDRGCPSTYERRTTTP
jgi:D-alanyl-D-alanine carboxypeptidase